MSTFTQAKSLKALDSTPRRRANKHTNAFSASLRTVNIPKNVHVMRTKSKSQNMLGMLNHLRVGESDIDKERGGRRREEEEKH